MLNLKVLLPTFLLLSSIYFSCKTYPDQTNFGSPKTILETNGISSKALAEQYPHDDPCNEYKLVHSTIATSLQIFLTNINRGIIDKSLDSTYYEYITSEERYLISIYINIDGDFVLLKLTNEDKSLANNNYYLPEGIFCAFLIKLPIPVDNFFSSMALTGKNLKNSLKFFPNLLNPKKSFPGTVYHEKLGKDQKPGGTMKNPKPPRRNPNGTKKYY